MQLKIASIERLTRSVLAFKLETVSGVPVPSFPPGSHITLTLAIAEGRTVRSSYSLTSDPKELGHYEIAVLRKPAGSGGSNFLHQEARVGTLLDASLPVDSFPMIAAHHSIFIAGGIGITPFLPMMRALAGRHSLYELHYAARNSDGFVYRELVKGLSGSQVTFYDSSQGGRIDLSALLRSPSEGIHLYICGPEQLISAATQEAAALNWPQNRVHVERFGSGNTAKDEPVEVHLFMSEQSFLARPGSSILDGLEAAGIWVPSECRRGVCGTCIVEYTAGEIIHRDSCISTEERRTAFCPCVSWATSSSITLNL